MRILIVEDSPFIAGAIERGQDTSQMSIDSATDGWDAIEKLESEDYAAIVVATDMPRQFDARGAATD